MESLQVEAHGEIITLQNREQAAEKCSFMAQLAMVSKDQYNAALDAAVIEIQPDIAPQQQEEPQATTVPAIGRNEKTVKVEPIAPHIVEAIEPVELTPQLAPETVVVTQDYQPAPIALRQELIEEIVHHEKLMTPPAVTELETTPAAIEESHYGAVETPTLIITPTEVKHTPEVQLRETQPAPVVTEELSPTPIKTEVIAVETSEPVALEPVIAVEAEPTPTLPTPERTEASTDGEQELPMSLDEALDIIIAQAQTPDAHDIFDEPTSLPLAHEMTTETELPMAIETVVNPVVTELVAVIKQELATIEVAEITSEAEPPKVIVESVVALLIETGYSEDDAQTIVTQYLETHDVKSFLMLAEKLCDRLEQIEVAVTVPQHDEHEFLKLPKFSLQTDDDGRHHLMREMFRLVQTFGYKSAFAVDIA